ncbi:MAG: hypothetical protein ABJH68_01955 [Ilumatobacter sp.]|uniref:hypothetical protein n=1 Tax=Ilumatobacter sp. TaxID=1967498 RepID=UPI00329A6D7F
MVLIVLGVGATLGGLYGQIFLAEDEGHHDGRTPTFALQPQVGSDELVVEQTAPGRLAVEVLRAGQAMQFDTLHDRSDHYFVTDAGLTFFSHVAFAQDGENRELATPPGEVRVVAQVAPTGGPDFLELGATVDVEGDPLDEQNITDDDAWTDGSLTVTRQGFDFVLSAPWNGNDIYDGPAFLSLFRADDFAFAHAHAELVGNDRFSFATALPGLGDYLAALEFEQDGRLVTALFRFTL